MKKIDVRDKFLVIGQNFTKVQSGSLHSCKRAVEILNEHETVNGRIPHYWVGLNYEYEGFRELKNQAIKLGLTHDFNALFSVEYKGE